MTANEDRGALFSGARNAQERAARSLELADRLLTLAAGEEDVYMRAELEAGARMYRELADIHEAAAEAQRRRSDAAPTRLRAG
jgi:hypothetical protein